MFGIGFFSNRVAGELFRRGYKAGDLPAPTFFKLVSDGLKANGYNKLRAAELWDRVMNADIAAFEEMKSNAGTEGAFMLTSLEILLKDTGRWPDEHSR